MSETREPGELRAIDHLDTVFSNAWWSVHKANRDAIILGDRDLSAEVRSATEVLLQVMMKVKRAKRKALKEERLSRGRAAS